MIKCFFLYCNIWKRVEIFKQFCGKIYFNICVLGIFVYFVLLIKMLLREDFNFNNILNFIQVCFVYSKNLKYFKSVY